MDSTKIPGYSRIRPKYADTAGFDQNPRIQPDSTKMRGYSRIRPKYPDTAGFDQNTRIQPDSTIIPGYSRDSTKIPGSGRIRSSANNCQIKQYQKQTQMWKFLGTNGNLIRWCLFRDSLSSMLPSALNLFNIFVYNKPRLAITQSKKQLGYIIHLRAYLTEKPFFSNHAGYGFFLNCPLYYLVA